VKTPTESTICQAGERTAFELPEKFASRLYRSRMVRKNIMTYKYTLSYTGKLK
jgi:hypothetical protein